MISLLQPAIDEAAALITVSGDWPSLLARPDEMARLLQNLLTNAIKFRVPGRRPEIAVSSSASAGHWHICVADNGVGIASGQAGRLFQVFQRLHSREAYEGTGVGLAICRRIVEHHGGKIRVESAGEGQGCRFLVDVPTGKDTTA